MLKALSGDSFDLASLATRRLTSLNQMDHTHWPGFHLIRTFSLESVRNGAGDVEARNCLNIATCLSRSQFHVVNDVIGDNVLLDLLTLSCDNIISRSARCNKDQATVLITVFNEVVNLHHATICHHHGHLNLLQQAAMSLNVRALNDRNFTVNLDQLGGQVLSEGPMIFECESRHDGFRDGHSETIFLCLA